MRFPADHSFHNLRLGCLFRAGRGDKCGQLAIAVLQRRGKLMRNIGWHLRQVALQIQHMLKPLLWINRLDSFKNPV